MPLPAPDLQDFVGYPVVITVSAGEWDPAREDAQAIYNRLLASVSPSPRRLLGLSTDGAWCRLRFADGEDRVPLLRLGSGASPQDCGLDGPAFYLVDADGIVRWRHLSVAAEPSRADELVEAVAAMRPRESSVSRRREFAAMLLLATAVLALRERRDRSVADGVPVPPGRRPAASVRRRGSLQDS